MLCHRLGLIPIKADADDFDEVPAAGENGHNRSDFTDKNVEYLTVYSKSLQLEKLGKQTDLPDGSIGLVHDDIILIKLAPGQVRLYTILFINSVLILNVMLQKE